VHQPAELIAAAAGILATGHVHAAAVLLDGCVAVRALLGVREQPVHVLRLV
jgi:hypothetical protein